MCLRPCLLGDRAGRWSRTSQTPLGERVPSAHFSGLQRALCAASLKPLSGNVCLRPQAGRSPSKQDGHVSNPSRGTCAFGLSAVLAAIEWARGLKPLSGNVCLRPATQRVGFSRLPDVSNPSRGTCAFGLVTARTSRGVARSVSNPSRGTCAFGRTWSASRLGVSIEVSNPSRGTCAFGRKMPRDDFRRELVVSNPSRGTCAFGLNGGGLVVTRRLASQTPLGERVPSALQVARLQWAPAAQSQTPLGERVPSARTAPIWRPLMVVMSQTPLGERVPSAYEGCIRALRRGCLKPLSGNVCLRPGQHGDWVLNLKSVSNPSRGTCAFGQDDRRFLIEVCRGSQTPLGERVPSATTPLSRITGDSVSNPSRGTCAFGRIGGLGLVTARTSLKPLSGNVCLRP